MLRRRSQNSPPPPTFPAAAPAVGRGGGPAERGVTLAQLQATHLPWPLGALSELCGQDRSWSWACLWASHMQSSGEGHPGEGEDGSAALRPPAHCHPLCRSAHGARHPGVQPDTCPLRSAHARKDVRRCVVNTYATGAQPAPACTVHAVTDTRSSTHTHRH